MKRFASLLLSALALICLIGCGRTMNDIISEEPCISGVVSKVSHNTILVDTTDAGQYLVSLEVLHPDSSTHFSIGDVVNVYYDGTIQETSPMQILTVYAITLQEPGYRESSLIDQGMDIISMIAEMAASESYFATFSYDQEIQKVAAEAGAGDYSAPSHVYEIHISEEQLRLAAGMDFPDLFSEELQKNSINRLVSSIPSQLNGAAGVQALAASSICTAGKTFVSTELNETALYLYVFSDGLPILVSFVPGEGSAVSASGSFLFYDGVPAGSPEQIAEFFSYAIGGEITVTELK